MENQITVKDVLIEVLSILNGIRVPVSEVQTIGVPISRASEGVQLCVDAMMKNEVKNKPEEPEQDPEASEDTDEEVNADE